MLCRGAVRGSHRAHHSALNWRPIAVLRLWKCLQLLSSTHSITGFDSLSTSPTPCTPLFTRAGNHIRKTQRLASTGVPSHPTREEEAAGHLLWEQDRSSSCMLLKLPRQNLRSKEMLSIQEEVFFERRIPLLELGNAPLW